MDTSLLHIPLGLATLLPLVSFFVILIAGHKMRPVVGGYIATGAICLAGLLSLWSALVWLIDDEPHVEVVTNEGENRTQSADLQITRVANVSEEAEHEAADDTISPSYAPSEALKAHEPKVARSENGEYYKLGEFGKLRMTIGYYIDSLTIVMFCLVTVIASCIHFYSMGYMHEEESEVTDKEVILQDGSYLKRRGRYVRFFQYMSLFCFSMLGLVLAGNLAMVFIFWELVGICSYFLIGFYVERKSASNAANKAFIVNRIGDFGMLIGIMALWTGLGTFSFGDVKDKNQIVTERGIFSQVRPIANEHQLTAPAGMALASGRNAMERWAGENPAATETQVDTKVHSLSYRMLIIAGIGIFCGCVGKSAQFPLHVWLPDAMEGPTPVSALVHSATMVAAGVYLVGRFYPVFAPEVLLVIAVVGVITLFIAATIAITATDIKRVLAYSTVSQLGFMMLALGLGGWLAGMMHLVTHAFFKSLLFLCSGSVIHAVHTNEMTEMGGLRKKMPITAYTMLVGCLAISGISLPFVIGFSGYY